MVSEENEKLVFYNVFYVEQFYYWLLNCNMIIPNSHGMPHTLIITMYIKKNFSIVYMECTL